MRSQHIIIITFLLMIFAISKINSEILENLSALIFVNNTTHLELGFKFQQNSKDDSLKRAPETDISLKNDAGGYTQTMEEEEEEEEDEYYNEFTTSSTVFMKGLKSKFPTTVSMTSTTADTMVDTTFESASKKFYSQTIPKPPPPPPTFECSPLEFVSDKQGIKHCKSNAENKHNMKLFLIILILNLSLCLFI